MVSSGRRIGMVISAVVVIVLGSTAVAHACDYPTIAVPTSTTQAGPGDVVPFTFSNTAPGAAYTVSVDGQLVASGTASGSSVTGSFVMPNLGSSRLRVNVEGAVTHSDVAPYEWKYPWPITYVPPASASTTTAAPAAPGSPAHASTPPASQHAAPPPSGPPAPGPGHAPRPGGGPSPHPTGFATAQAGAAAASSAASAAQARGSHAITATAAAPSSAQRTRAGTHGVAAQIRHARTGPVAPYSMPASVWAAPRNPGNGGDPAATVALTALLALLALGGGGAAALRVLHHRRPLTPPLADPDAVPMSEADTILQGVDLDAELRGLLAREDEAQANPSSEPGPRSSDLVR